MPPLNRRAFLSIAALSAAASASACASSSAPARTSDVPGAAPAPPTPAPPAAGTEMGEWDDLIAAARAEGALSLLTLVGGGYQTVIERFQQAFPGIAVQRLAESSARVWLGQVREGQRAGRYEFDLAFVQPNQAIAEGGPAGVWAPLKPLFVRPDILDDRAWRDGLVARFMDAGGVQCFAWEYQVIHAYAINTELVPPGEITSATDLLDPRWKARILSLDPRLGTGLLSATSVARQWGADVVKRLLVDQQPTIRSWGPNEATEALVRGDYPIALGVRPKALNPMRAQGRGHQIRYLDLPDADFVGATAMLYFDRAPHPAAARLFANWILTQPVQTALASSLTTNSARTDVDPFEPDGIGAAGTSYFEPERETNFQYIAETQRLVSDLLRNRD